MKLVFHTAFLASLLLTYVRFHGRWWKLFPSRCPHWCCSFSLVHTSLLLEPTLTNTQTQCLKKTSLNLNKPWNIFILLFLDCSHFFYFSISFHFHKTTGLRQSIHFRIKMRFLTKEKQEWHFSKVEILFYFPKCRISIGLFVSLFVSELPRVSQGLFFCMQMSYLWMWTEIKKINFHWRLVLVQTCHGRMLRGRHADMLWTDSSESRQI